MDNYSWRSRCNETSKDHVTWESLKGTQFQSSKLKEEKKLSTMSQSIVREECRRRDVLITMILIIFLEFPFNIVNAIAM